MSFVRVQPMELTPIWAWGESTLKIFSSSPFFEFTTGLYVGEGNLQDVNSFCQSIACTLDGTTLTLPEFTLATTVDSSVSTALMSAGIYDSNNVLRYTMLDQFFVDPYYFQSPAQSSVLVEDAGSTIANGNYTYRGQFNNRPYYNLAGQADSTSLYAIFWNGASWRLTNAAGSVLYTAATGDFPWEEAWSASGGISPAPNVNENQELVVATWEQLTISNQGTGAVYPFGLPGPFWNIEQTKQYVNSIVGTGGATPFANEQIVGKTALSANPLSSSFPVAVGTQDPVWLDTNETKYLRSYENDLQDAIDDIGSTNTTLAYADSIPVTASLTVPSNIRLLQQGNGVLNISSGQVLTVANGLGFEAPGDKCIFTGAGTVYFSASQPAWVYPEWWGAVGDGTTDDSAAFNAIMTTYPDSFYTMYIHIAAGKVYKLNSAWQIDNRVVVDGGGTLKTAANTTGIIVHAVATKTGVNDGRSAEKSIFRNINLIGNNGASPDTVTSTNTVNVSGTTVTKTAGPNFVAADGFIEGNTVTINDYTYVIESRTSNSIFEIKEFPLQLGAINGSPTLSANDFRSWDITGTWEGQNIIIEGVTYVIDTVFNASGFKITLTTNYSGATATGLTAYVQGLAVTTGLAARVNLFHGFDIRAQCEIHHCRVEQFPGNALSYGGSSTQGIPGTTPNENDAYAVRNTLVTNAGSGIFSQGVNSNQIVFINNNSTDNRGCGTWEHGFLGNQYFGNEYAFNYSGSIDEVLNGINGSTRVGDYTESGQPGAILAQNTIVLGGNYGAGFSSSSQGSFILGSAGFVSPRNLLVSQGVTATYTKAIMFGIIAGNLPGSIFGWGAAEETANIAAGYSSTVAKYPAIQLIYDAATGIYNLDFKVNSSDVPTARLLRFSGSQAADGGGKLYLPTGFIGGTSTAERTWSYVTTKPVTGTAALGDIYWNKVAGTTNPIGWICTTAGDLSTTGVVTPFGANNLEAVAGTAGTLAQFAAGASGGVKLANATETGTGSVVRATSPTLVTPVLGTPSSGTLTACTVATASAGDNDTSIASTAFVQGGGVGALYWTALISQAGTSGPSAVVKNNTLGGTIVLARTGVGVYTLTLASAFPTAARTFFDVTWNNVGGGGGVMAVNPVWTSANVVTITTWDRDNGAIDLDTNSPISVTITVYPT